MLEIPCYSKGIISKISDCIAPLKNITLAKIRADWVDELGEDLKEDAWNTGLQRVNDSSSCAKLSMIQFKVLHCTNSSRVKLAKIYPNIDTRHDKCHSTPAN